MHTAGAVDGLAAKCARSGEWKRSRSGHQGKMLHLLHGRLCFSIGWTGLIQQSGTSAAAEPASARVRFDIGAGGCAGGQEQGALLGMPAVNSNP